MLNDPAQPGSENSPAHSGTERPSPKVAKPRRVVRAILFTLLGLVVVLVAVVAALVAFPPASLLTPIIVKTASAQIGRELKIGSASYAFRPDFVLHLQNVTLSNPPGVAGPDFLNVASVDASIDVRSLLKGGITVSGVTINQPVISLHRDASGKENWDLPPPNPNVVLAQLSVAGGTLNYQDDQAKQSYQVSNITGSLAQNGAALESKLAGTTVWRSEPVNFDVDLSDVHTVIAGTPTNMTADVSSKNATGKIVGTVTLASNWRVQGTFTANTPSVVALAGWLGTPPPTNVKVGAVALAGTVDATAGVVALQKTQLTLNGANSVWDVKLDLTKKPTLTGTVDAPLLDVSAITGSTPAGPSGLAAVAQAPSSPLVFVPAYQSLAQDLDTLNNRLNPSPQGVAATPVKAAAPPSLWNDEIVDLAALEAVDVDVKAQADKINFGRLQATNGVLAVAVQDGKVDLTVQQLQIASGHVTGHLGLQGAQGSKPAQTSVTVGIDGVPVETILVAFMPSAPLTGSTTFDLSATGAGRTQKDLVSSLTGKASFSLQQGAIQGFDLRTMVLEWWKSWSFDASQKTEFSKLQGSYDIQKGDLRNVSDLAFQGKDVDISSSGDINLSTGALDQSLRLQLTPPPTSLPIPLKIGGTLTAPTFGFDFLGVFENPTTLASPAQVSPSPQNMPDAIRTRVTSALSTGANLSPKAKESLQALLPQASPSQPSSPAPNTTGAVKH
jgi:AsmA protein